MIIQIVKNATVDITLIPLLITVCYALIPYSPANTAPITQLANNVLMGFISPLVTHVRHAILIFSDANYVILQQYVSLVSLDFIFSIVSAFYAKIYCQTVNIA